MSRDPHETLKDMSRAVPDELIRFGSALSAAGFMGDGWDYFLQRTEKWAGEYSLWVNAGRPTQDHRDAQWALFCDQLASLEPSL